VAFIDNLCMLEVCSSPLGVKDFHKVFHSSFEGFWMNLFLICGFQNNNVFKYFLVGWPKFGYEFQFLQTLYILSNCICNEQQHLI